MEIRSALQPACGHLSTKKKGGGNGGLWLPSFSSFIYFSHPLIHGFSTDAQQCWPPLFLLFGGRSNGQALHVVILSDGSNASVEMTKAHQAKIRLNDNTVNIVVHLDIRIEQSHYQK